MSAADYAEPLAYANAFNMQLFDHPNVGLEELGRAAADLSRKFRTLALICLLEQGDTERYYQNLQRSGQIRLEYLRRASGSPDFLYHQATGRAGAMFDCIAANDFALANNIADLSTHTFFPKFEYEDDYCVAQLLNVLVRDPVPIADAIPRLEQFEQYLGGEISAMFDCLSALIDRDDDAFAEAFENLLIENAVTIQEQAEKELDSVEHLMRRQLFVEGIALLRLAQRLGMRTEPDYQFCPRLARGQAAQPFDPLFD